MLLNMTMLKRVLYSLIKTFLKILLIFDGRNSSQKVSPSYTLQQMFLRRGIILCTLRIAFGGQGETLQINIIRTPSTFISLITITTTPNFAIKRCFLSASHTLVKLTLWAAKEIWAITWKTVFLLLTFLEQQVRKLVSLWVDKRLWVTIRWYVH